MAKKKFVTMRIDQETHDYLMMMAERERRTMANLINLMLFNAIEADKRASK